MPEAKYFSPSVTHVLIHKGASAYRFDIHRKDGTVETVDFSSMTDAERREAYGAFIRQSRQHYTNRKGDDDRPAIPRKRKRR